jgi:hypothetical protein
LGGKATNHTYDDLLRNDHDISTDNPFSSGPMKSNTTDSKTGGNGAGGNSYGMQIKFKFPVVSINGLPVSHGHEKINTSITHPKKSKSSSNKRAKSDN